MIGMFLLRWESERRGGGGECMGRTDKCTWRSIMAC